MISISEGPFVMEPYPPKPPYDRILSRDAIFIGSYCKAILRHDTLLNLLCKSLSQKVSNHAGHHGSRACAGLGSGLGLGLSNSNFQHIS